jgi:hypothetical protein
MVVETRISVLDGRKMALCIKKLTVK